MTTTPRMETVPMRWRIASTAAASAPFFSPRPTQRPAAIAAASVTRTSSIARLRSGASWRTGNTSGITFGSLMHPNHRLKDVDADLVARRDDYPILAERTYLVSHSLGAMHRGTRDRLAAYADSWATEGVVAWEHWIGDMARVGDLV